MSGILAMIKRRWHFAEFAITTAISPGYSTGSTCNTSIGSVNRRRGLGCQKNIQAKRIAILEGQIQVASKIVLWKENKERQGL